MGIHGGTDETSLMLHLAPDLVDMSVGHPQCARAIWPTTATCGSAARSGSGGCRTTSGPTATSAIRRRPAPSAAAMLFEAAVTAFAEALGEVAAFEFGR